MSAKARATTTKASPRGCASGASGVRAPPFPNADHCLLAVLYERLDDEASAIARTAAELARQLGPLPAALSTIARRVRRHHAHYGYPKDDTLGAELDGLEARTFDLWKAVTALFVAARAASPMNRQDIGATTHLTTKA